MKYYCLAISVLILVASCKKENSLSTVPPPATVAYFPPVTGSNWAGTTPSSLGWNEAELANLYAYLQQKDSRAFIILKNGKIGHQLTMTTGLDDNVQPDNDCTSSSCLVYKSEAGTRWAYHNAPYTLLDKVIESASSGTYNSYFQKMIRDKIGMNGLWIRTGFNNVYISNARSMARFGLLMLNKGKWDQAVILGDTSYLNSQTNTSQDYNPSYGYLTWLNGKPRYMLPTLQNVFTGPMIPTAPADMYAALGKNDQKVYVVRSQQLVVIRMGESAGNSQLAVSSFDTELWGRLKTVMRY